MNLETKKQAAILALAVGLGIVAAFAMSQYVQNRISQETKRLAKEYQKKYPVLLDQIDLMKRKINQLSARQEAIARQQQESRKRLAAQGTGTVNPVVPMSSFSVRTPLGKRAVTIQIDSLAAVGGLINPGDFVDVIAHLKVPEERDNPKSKKKETSVVLFQNIQILSVGTNFNPVGSKPAYQNQAKAKSLRVTLALEPQQIGFLTFAQKHGRLQLALRSPAEQNTRIPEIPNWETLSQYILSHQGTKIDVPKKKEKKKKKKKRIKPVLKKEEKKEKVEKKPLIRIFKRGSETSL